ncbi:MAG TPA: hypothetical protein PKK06_10060 [Phycisphaerae bacterium]|nr:hypothetical protein [Phycisphaerae bacterium]HNU45630.1 hypothetical protein [Phycisphaerae bacterium]
MMQRRVMRLLMVLGSGALLLQAGGCNLAGFNELIQTVLLGITAAGSIVIIRNI